MGKEVKMNFRTQEEIEQILKKQDELRFLHRAYLEREVDQRKSVELRKKAFVAEIQEKYGEFEGFTDYDLGEMNGISKALRWVRGENIYPEEM